MKSVVLATALLASAATLLAGGNADTAYQLLSDDGNISAVNVCAESVAQCTWVTLNEKAGYKVLCQVYYADNLNPDPSEPDEIEYAHYIEDFLNFCLTNFLSDRCKGMSPEAVMRDYRSGKIRASLVKDFGKWFQAATDEMNAGEDIDVVNIDILAVSMRAVGTLAKAVAE